MSLTPSSQAASEAAQSTVQVRESTRLHCPHCGCAPVRRLQRKGFLQNKVYPLFGYFPWVCMTCKMSSMLRKRQERRSKKQKTAE
jgi:hypothetical protein